LIEVAYVANLGALALVLHHREDWCEALTTSTCISLAMFIGLLLYHVYLEIKRHVFRPNNGFQSLLFWKSTSNNSLKEIIKDDSNEDSSDKRDGHSTTYVELRETLIDN